MLPAEQYHKELHNTKVSTLQIQRCLDTVYPKDKDQAQQELSEIEQLESEYLK